MEVADHGSAEEEEEEGQVVQEMAEVVVEEGLGR